MRFLIFGLLLLGAALPAVPQSAAISGNLTDETGAVIPGATVEAKSEGGKSFRSATDGQGEYRLVLPGGLYKISVSRQPFTNWTVTGYWVPQSGSMKLDIALRCLNCGTDEDLVYFPPLIETKEATCDESLNVQRRPSEKLKSKTPK